ncbi:MAG: 50S ribosomal protein L32 [Planctomycetia bacterium]
MAVPKRRKSHSKARMGKAHKKVHPISLVYCESCKAPTLPHRVCPACGFFQGRIVVRHEES